MSADWCSVSLYMYPMDENERKKAMLAAVRSKDFDWKSFYTDNDDEPPDTKKEALEEIKTLIEGFFDMLKQSNNYSTTWIPGLKFAEIIYAGGMSWGEDPSDDYTTILRIANLPQEILEAGKINIEVDLLAEVIKDPKMPNSLKERIKQYMAARVL